MDDDFSIATSVEGVTEGQEFRDQFLIVVDFAVEDDTDTLIFVIQWLLSGGEVNDGKAAVAETDAGLDMQATFVGAAVELRLVHTMENRTINVAFASGIEYSGDAAHVLSLPAYAEAPTRPSNLS